MRPIAELLSEMTLEEKASILAGHKSWHTVAIDRLGIPSIYITDGPHGLRKKRDHSKEVGLGETELSTAFPPAVTTASSFDTSLLHEMGVAMGVESNYYDVSVILGPAVNIKRNPLCGRSFEYFSEDPLLTGEMGAALTRGIESCEVGTSVKHFACNNNEANRMFGDSVVDERALREIYLRGFERIVKKSNPATLMCAYNQINGEYASENKHLLTEILRDEWGFEGLVMSDWGAVNERARGVEAGLDLEMPGDVEYNKHAIIKAVNGGELSTEALDRSVLRVLAMIERGVKAKEMLAERGPIDEPFTKHSRLAKRIAEESAVLLKNDGVLPLKKEEKLLVIGEMFDKMRYQGAGSSLLSPYSLITPKAAFDSEGVDYVYKVGYIANSDEINEKLENEAVGTLEDFDTVLFFGGLSENAESEGMDRTTMALPKNQVSLLTKLVESGKRVVFVFYGGSPVELPMFDGLSAMLSMYLPGEMGGAATYSLLFGETSPSGRLAETWPHSADDVPFSGEFTRTTEDLYKESIFVGYRYYNTYGVDVRFPFGYGLSYSSFSYSDLKISETDLGYEVSVKVRNDGNIRAAETVLLFVDSPRTRLVKAARELRAFTKLTLDVGEEAVASMLLPREDLRCYVGGEYILEGGDYSFVIAKDVNTPILTSSVYVEGTEAASLPEVEELYSTRERMLAMSDKDFEKVIGREIVRLKTEPPYDMNVPIRKYETLGGKFLKGVILFGIGCMRFFARLEKDSPEKITKLKNIDFVEHAALAVSPRAMCFTSEGLLSHRRAEALLAIANNHPLKALWMLITPEKFDDGEKETDATDKKEN